MRVQIIVNESDVQAFVRKAFKDKSVVGLWGKATVDGRVTFEVTYK